MLKDTHFCEGKKREENDTQKIKFIHFRMGFKSCNKFIHLPSLPHVYYDVSGTPRSKGFVDTVTDDRAHA